MNNKSIQTIRGVIEELNYFIENDKFRDTTCAADLAHYLQDVIGEEDKKKS